MSEVDSRRWIGIDCDGFGDGLGPGKRFSRSPSDPGVEQRTVNDGTNDLVNLAGLNSIGAGEASRQSRQGIGAERLDGAGDGGRTGKSSPPEGPGETAKKKRVRGVKLVKRGKMVREMLKFGYDIPLEHDEGVEERGGIKGKKGVDGGKRGKKRNGKRLVDCTGTGRP